jgi:protein TonB
MTLAPFYRQYELPWSPSEEVEARFRKIMWVVFALFATFAIVVPLLPVPEKTLSKAPDIPDRIVKLVIEKQVPPPPPPPKVEEKKPEPLKVEPKPEPKPQPQVPDARERAQKSGLLKLQDQLADLRNSTVLDKAAQTKNLTGAVGEQTRSERSLLTSKVGTGSGGINTAELSRGYGGGAGALTGHNTTQVTSAVLEKQAEDGVRRGSGNKASRSEEEIALIFDRNKGAIYSIYTRALREKPDLRGKVVLELTIAPDGSVTRCDVISSELNDPELERRLVTRIKQFRFEAKDVGAITVTKPIDFFPA